jgi:hypothetical protein
VTGCEKCDGDGILNVSWSLDGTSDDFVRCDACHGTGEVEAPAATSSPTEDGRCRSTKVIYGEARRCEWQEGHDLPDNILQPLHKWGVHTWAASPSAGLTVPADTIERALTELYAVVPREVARVCDDSLSARVAALEQALARTVYLAEHLLQMIDRETWRAHGGDDGQGHYEGDYRAEQVASELRDLAALAAVRTPEQKT